MEIKWLIEEQDVQKLKAFVKKNDNPFVRKVITRNVSRNNMRINKDSFIRSEVMCLISSQQPSGPNTPVGKFLQTVPFPVNYELVLNSKDVKVLLRNILLNHGLNRFITKIPKYFEENWKILESTNWEILDEINSVLQGDFDKSIERNLADKIDRTFKGFGPKQSRNLLQTLGVTKFEVPIDSRITKWLNEFGFPVKLTSNALLDRSYYHFVQDGFQELCAKADIFPVVVDAAIFSSFDKGQWTEENLIY